MSIYVFTVIDNITIQYSYIISYDQRASQVAEWKSKIIKHKLLPELLTFQNKSLTSFGKTFTHFPILEKQHSSNVFLLEKVVVDSNVNHHWVIVAAELQIQYRNPFHVSNQPVFIKGDVWAVILSVKSSIYFYGNEYEYD